MTPVSREDSLVFATPPPIAAHRTLSFSNGAYACLFAFFVLHLLHAIQAPG
ncbi:MAG TPA: hypothetical protein VHK24_01270 [Steroidobacter sp.]|nr:hypothetical protein [Steroidobacter sp.]